MKWLPAWEIQPGIYAMCGAAAMLGGVFRASISLVVLFVEGSQVSLPEAHMQAQWGLNAPPHGVTCIEAHQMLCTC